MQKLLGPLKADSLKDVFVERFEGLILSGSLAIGQRLPSERELALQLGVSRPVVHEGLMDLAAKGLVRMQPRRVAEVGDYRREGSLAMLNSLLAHHNGSLEPQLLEGLMELRALVEIEVARRAALFRDDRQLAALEQALADELAADQADIDTVAELDFGFHLELAMATENMIYPMLLNSFKDVYTNLTRLFFHDPANITQARDFHRRLVRAIQRQNPDAAGLVMSEMLAQGRAALLRQLGD